MMKIRFLTKAWRKFSTEARHIQWQEPAGQNTGIYIYNCVARRKVPLVLANSNYLSWYSCGPTVYDAAHIGHASSYVKLDIIQRILRDYFKHNVVSAMNITDIDDKIIMRSREANVPFAELSRKYETEFWHDMRKLNVREPNLKVRVSENLPKIINFIAEIKAKGLAYIGQDKSVYFSVKKYPNYGKLQNVNLEEDAKFTTSSSHLSAKLDAADFALWKATANTKDEPHFQSPWGPGRPGWHIECSALASMIFGHTIDIHAGGLDLRFPHHENEEAQSCVHHNCQQWVNYWLHTGALSLKGQANKMSKSLKNTISIADMLSQHTADEFRMACLLSNYKNNMEYGEDVMQLATNTLNKFKCFENDCRAYLEGLKVSSNINDNDLWLNLSAARKQLDVCLRDDFDTSRALSILVDYASSVSTCINNNNNTKNDGQLQVGSSLHTIAAASNFVQNTFEMLGFQYASGQSQVEEEEKINVDEMVGDLLKARWELREIASASKNKHIFRLCDNLRNLIQKQGIEIKDHAQGSTFSFKKLIN